MDLLVHQQPTPQRLVFLIDLHPLSSPSADPTSYFTPILSSIRRLLSSPHLPAPAPAPSLSALRFFFSHLSPISSASATHRLLGKCPTSLSFNNHSHTLLTLSQTLHSIASNPDLPNLCTDGKGSKAALLAKSLLQLENEYAWETKRYNADKSEPGLLRFPSNLVILFSPVLQDHKSLAQFVDLDTTGDIPIRFDDFAKQFGQQFDPVRERLDSKDIGLSWVRVGSEIGLHNEMTGGSNWIERVLKEHNWGCSSTDAIVMGSSIIPVGLIFPFIASSIGHMHGKSTKNAPMDFILKISDVNGKPLECKSCKFEALHLQPIDKRSVEWIPSIHNFGTEITKVCVEGVRKIGDSERVLKSALSVVIVHGFSSKPIEESTRSSTEVFFPDIILESFCTENGQVVREMPIWQLFLSFLYCRNYSAMVSIPARNNNYFEGVLMPFTINHGLLYIFEKGFLEKERCRCCLPETRGDKRRRKQAIEHLLGSQDIVSFRDVALSYSETGISEDICDLYFHKFSLKLKKLKFFKCWVNQMRESCNGRCNLIVKERESEAENTSQGVPFEDQMDTNDVGVSPFSSLDEAETFLGSVEEKIEEGLLLEDGNLGTSVGSFIRLVIDAVSKKMGGEGDVCLEMANLILKKPKDLLAKYKGRSYNANYKLREHEVQILFRMEILNAMSGSQIEESRKQRMIRDICLLLQFIDLNLQNNSSTVASSILDFAERTIKSRYSQSVPDIVQQIYSQMEFDMSEQDGAGAFDSPNNTDPDNTSDVNVEKLSIHEQVDNILEKKRLEARERIDRQRRFKSFTSWMPDLHRVWALKQPKYERSSCNLRPPPSSSRRKRRRVSGNFVVRETPMTAAKEATTDTRAPNRSSLSKALFLDEFDSL